MNNYEQKILDALLAKNLITKEKAEEFRGNLKNIEDSLEGMLLEDPNISSKDILSIKSNVSKLPPAEVRDINKISPDLLKEIPEEAARQYKIVPLGRVGNKLRVGIVDPEDYRARDAVRFIAMGSDVTPEVYVITQETFKKILGQYRTFRTQIKEALLELEKELKEERKIPKKIIIAEALLKEAPVTKVVAVILKHAVEGKASDIHIEATPGRTRVRFRVHGTLYTSLFLPPEIHASVVSRIKILSNLRLDETRIPQDGRFSAEISGQSIDFRVSTFPTRIGEKAVLRVLDPSIAIRDLPELGLRGRSLAIVSESLSNSYGMILISGPTGSGKSTTLYAALSSVDKEGLNVVSLEDPIEYNIEGVSQSQVRPEIGYTFAEGLRHVLRQDPDIIMVGEIRDSETATLATHAALTGHLVFSTIHTNNAIGVIPRMIDMGVSAFLIPSSVSLAIAQRLLRRLCPYCKIRESAPPKIAAFIKKEIEDMNESARSDSNLKAQDSYELWRSPGCDKCSRSGTIGRIGIFEVLMMTKQLKEIIYTEPNEIKIEEEARRQGMLTLRQDGIIKALQGIISIDEVISAIEES
ncbi:MAG: GspE/PulE family protein [Candidatus Spechtbacterales bacterium]